MKEYSSCTLTPVGVINSERKKLSIRVVVSDYFMNGLTVTIVNLKTLVKTSNVKVVKRSNSDVIINSMFTPHANKMAILQRITEQEANEMRIKESPTNSYLIYNNRKIILMTIIDDAILQDLKDKVRGLATY